MTIATRNPENPNILHPNKFQISCPRMPNIQYFAQALSLPGIALSEAVQPTPFVDLYVPGEKAIYDLINITFMIDEELKGWIEVHDWLRAMTFPVKYSEYKNLSNLHRNTTGVPKDKFPQYSDINITLLTSKNNPCVKFTFYDCFPTTLSSFLVSSSDTPENVVTSDVSIRYSYYDIQSLI